MSDDEKTVTLTIDGIDYSVNDMSDNAKELLANVQFVDAQIQQLSNEWAVADTARIGYSKALSVELSKTNISAEN